MSTGRKKRTYTVKKVSQRRRRGGGKDCDPNPGGNDRRRRGWSTINSGTKDEFEVCATNCKGHFTDWTACDQYSGKLTRDYVITRDQELKGTDCDPNPGGGTTRRRGWDVASLKEARKKTEEKICKVDCVGSWGVGWTDCKNGLHHKTYQVKYVAKNGGKSCDTEADNNGHRRRRSDRRRRGADIKSGRKRKSESCGENCKEGWGEWSKCSAAKTSRVWTISKQSGGGGAPCAKAPGTLEFRECQEGVPLGFLAPFGK